MGFLREAFEEGMLRLRFFLASSEVKGVFKRAHKQGEVPEFRGLCGGITVKNYIGKSVKTYDFHGKSTGAAGPGWKMQ